MLLLLYIIIRFVELYSLNSDDVQRESLRQLFPLFRGNGLFIAAFWLLAFDVNIFEKYNINYQLVFKFNHHFSQMYEIL